jgi:hypothetical protein
VDDLQQRAAFTSASPTTGMASFSANSSR